MPIYAYKCEACGFSKDVLQKLSDDPLSDCPSCGAQAFQKQLTAAGFQLKGSGWYVTDFKPGKAPAAGAAEAKPDAATTASGEVKPDAKAPAKGAESNAGKADSAATSGGAGAGAANAGAVAPASVAAATPSSTPTSAPARPSQSS